MTMNKKTKTAIGIGVVALAGYLLYKQSQKKSFANLTRLGSKAISPLAVTLVPACQYSPTQGGTYTASDGQKYFECCKQGVFGRIKADKDCNAATGTTKMDVLTF